MDVGVSGIIVAAAIGVDWVNVVMVIVAIGVAEVVICAYMNMVVDIVDMIIIIKVEVGGSWIIAVGVVYVPAIICIVATALVVCIVCSTAIIIGGGCSVIIRFVADTKLRAISFL